jgi:hypothetical protein
MDVLQIRENKKFACTCRMEAGQEEAEMTLSRMEAGQRRSRDDSEIIPMYRKIVKFAKDRSLSAPKERLVGVVILKFALRYSQLKPLQWRRLEHGMYQFTLTIYAFMFM